MTSTRSAGRAWMLTAEMDRVAAREEDRIEERDGNSRRLQSSVPRGAVKFSSSASSPSPRFAKLGRAVEHAGLACP